MIRNVHLPRKTIRHVTANKARYGAALITAMAGATLTVISSAATFATQMEAESGTLSRVDMAVSDSGASGGKSIRFGTASPAQPPVDTAFMSFGHDMYNFVGGAAKTINGTTLRLTTGGDFQVVNNAGTVLWHTNTSANCSIPSNCRVVLQADGNLVLYGPGGPLWGSGTWNTTGVTLIFQPRDPYLTIRNYDYDVVWTSNGNNTAGALGMLNGALTAPRAPSVKSFLDSMGVAMHMEQDDGDPVKVWNKLSYLGVKTIRQGYPEDDSLRNNFLYQAERGIRFNVINYPRDDNSIVVRAAETVAGMPNSPLESVEGLNEINNFPFTCNGSTYDSTYPQDNGPAAQCYMESFFSRVKASSKIGNAPVYHLTGNTTAVDADKYGLLGLDKQADYGNIHPYPAATKQPHNDFLVSLGSSYFSVPPSKAVITETGYPSAQSSLRTQAIYYLNIYLDAFQEGFKKTFIYELKDNFWETHGMFDINHNPKPSATAIHNLTTILADSGMPRNGTLNYSIAGMPKEAYSFALQRSNGSYNLAVWDERPIWNGADITPSAASINVNFGRSFSAVKVFKPYTGTNVTQTAANASSINLQLTGEPLVLELTP